MNRCLLICLLFGPLALGQTSKNPVQPSVANAPDQSGAGDEVRSDAPVITLKGICQPSHAGPASGNCTTVVTRAEFEKIVAAIQPAMPWPEQQKFATNYGRLVALSQKAHEMGLDQGQEFEEHMEIARLSIISEALSQAWRNQVQIADKDIENYYHANLAKYQQAELQRMYIPRLQQFPRSKQKLTDAEAQARKQQSEQTMKTEAEKLHARAVAGENFNKLQDEAFELAGIHAGPSNTNLGKTQRDALSPSEEFVMDLKPGEVSRVIEELSGFVVYRVDAKSTDSLDQVRDEIRNALIAQRVQEQVEGLLQSANPAFDQRYFGPPDPPARSRH